MALVLILMLGEGLSLALRSVTLHRSYMDNLALAVESDHTPHRVVLLGDSITLNATRRFALGRGPSDVANLATIAWTGAAAELFLLDRYLQSHPAPQYVIYASAPDDLNNGDSPKLIHYYDWNVYTRAEEHAFLRTYVPGIDAGERLPAVLNVQENIFERLTSLAGGSPRSLSDGVDRADPAVLPDPLAENRVDPRVQEDREAKALKIGALQAAVFRGICSLGRRYGFKVEIVWPPVPAAVLQAWSRRDELAALDREILATLGPACDHGPIFDVNAMRPYTDFNRDGFHLHGPLWEERYAADLSQFVASLPDRAAVASLRRASAADADDIR